MKNNLHHLPQNAVQLIKDYLLNLQAEICTEIERMDIKGQFISDTWERMNGGGGITRALENGHIFAKAGVNFSHVSGENLPPSASANRPELAGRKFSALGVSIIIHAENPYVPTTHGNVRFFIAEKENAAPIWWFGGGFDLTPYYGFVEDCEHWHRTAKEACEPFGSNIYPQFKAWCDRYFYLPHRQEARGIGGLFFDDYHEHSFQHSFDLMKNIGSHFMQAYSPIVIKRRSTPYTEQQKAIQLYRRGRYVEFNLLYDRGTLFGLQSNGRTESILLSLPPEVRWSYDWQPAPGTEEAKLYTDFLPAREWI